MEWYESINQSITRYQLYVYVSSVSMSCTYSTRSMCMCVVLESVETDRNGVDMT